MALIRGRLGVSGMMLLAALFLFCLAFYVWLGMDSPGPGGTPSPDAPAAEAAPETSPVPRLPGPDASDVADPNPPQAQEPAAAYPSGLDAEAAVTLSRLAADLALPPVATTRLAQRLTLMSPVEQRRFLAELEADTPTEPAP